EGVDEAWTNKPPQLQLGWMDIHISPAVHALRDPDVIIVSVLVLRTQSHASICTSDRLVQLTAGLATNLKTSRGHRVVRNVVPLYSVSL
ncbi:hypothetical protein PISMIDRAFT_93474, partial [Pisolithus microcarpus 441]